MWFIRGFMFLLMLFVLAYFFITNSGQAVDLKFMGTLYPAISIYWVVVVSFLLGFLTSFLMAAWREFQLRRQMRRFQKDIKAKDKEISALRKLPLQENGQEQEKSSSGGSADA